MLDGENEQYDTNDHEDEHEGVSHLCWDIACSGSRCTIPEAPLSKGWKARLQIDVRTSGCRERCCRDQCNDTDAPFQADSEEHADKEHEWPRVDCSCSRCPRLVLVTAVAMFKRKKC